MDAQSERSEANAVHALLTYKDEFGRGEALEKARFVNNAIRSIVSSNLKHRQPFVPTSQALPKTLRDNLTNTCLA